MQRACIVKAKAVCVQRCVYKYCVISDRSNPALMLCSSARRLRAIECPPPTSSKCFFTCACVRARLCVRQCARVHKHTHPHRHARVLCVNSLRSRLFICEKTGAINPPADFGRSPARGPGEGSALLGGGCSWCSKRDALRPSWTLPALGVCPSLGGQGRCYAARSNLGF